MTKKTGTNLVIDRHVARQAARDVERCCKHHGLNLEEAGIEP